MHVYVYVPLLRDFKFVEERVAKRTDHPTIRYGGGRGAALRYAQICVEAQTFKSWVENPNRQTANAHASHGRSDPQLFVFGGSFAKSII